MKKHTNRRTSTHRRQAGDSYPLVGYQWGEPFNNEETSRLTRSDNAIVITAVMPRYISASHPSDLISQHELAREARRHKVGFAKNAPHIRFANAENEEELIEFVRQFGPVVASTWTILQPHLPTEILTSKKTSRIEVSMRAEQNLSELKNEQQIYKAALELALELAKDAKLYDYMEVSTKISDIAHLVRNWPIQWRRERKARGEAPLWKVRPGTIERIAAMEIRGPKELLSPQVDARIVLSELLNVFPAFVFPNPLEMHSYLRYGIRPLLYGILRREFVYPSEITICINTKCRKFFDADRAGQQYCSPQCSRQYRQRTYWQQSGKLLREERKSKQDHYQ